MLESSTISKFVTLTNTELLDTIASGKLSENDAKAAAKECEKRFPTPVE